MEKKSKKRRVQAFAVLQDDGDGWLPIAITFKQRSLLQENVSRSPTRVVNITLTYEI